MNCPECGSSQQRVIDSRSAGNAVRRRRVCDSCGYRWRTMEFSVGTQTRAVGEADALRRENQRLTARLNRAASDMSAAIRRLTTMEEQND